jgi:CheY-like chemotaxis protein
VVHDNQEFREALCRNLERKGYLVLEAENATEAVDIAVRHSRRIHLLLADDNDEARVLMAKLRPYRRFLIAMYVSTDLEPDSILAEVSKVLRRPGHGVENTESLLDNVRAALIAAVEEARERFVDATQNSLKATKDASSGMPAPDGVTRLERPHYDRRRAFDEYLQALKRLEDHIIAADTQREPKQGTKQRN